MDFDKEINALKNLPWDKRVSISFDDMEIQTSKTPAKDATGPRGKISWDAQNLLIMAACFPLTLSELYEKCHLEGSRATGAKKQLIKLGYVKQSIVNTTSGRGRKKSVLEILPLGREMLNIIDERIKLHGKGSSKHRYIQSLICDFFKTSRPGYTASIEVQIGNTLLDVLAVHLERGIRIGFEICLNDRYEAINARKDIDTGMLNYLIFVSDSNETLERVRQKVTRTLCLWDTTTVLFKVIDEKNMASLISECEK